MPAAAPITPRSERLAPLRFVGGVGQPKREEKTDATARGRVIDDAARAQVLIP